MSNVLDKLSEEAPPSQPTVVHKYYQKVDKTRAVVKDSTRQHKFQNMLKQIKKPALTDLFKPDAEEVKIAIGGTGANEKSEKERQQQTTSFFKLNEVAVKEKEANDRFNFINDLDKKLLTSPTSALKKSQITEAPKKKPEANVKSLMEPVAEPKSEPKQTMSFGDKKNEAKPGPDEEEKSGLGHSKSSINLLADVKV